MPHFGGYFSPKTLSSGGTRRGGQSVKAPFPRCLIPKFGSNRPGTFEGDVFVKCWRIDVSMYGRTIELPDTIPTLCGYLENMTENWSHERLTVISSFRGNSIRLYENWTLRAVNQHYGLVRFLQHSPPAEGSNDGNTSETKIQLSRPIHAVFPWNLRPKFPSLDVCC